MIFVEEIVPRETIPGNIEKDVLVMGWEKRRRARQRVFTSSGRELAIALPTGTVMNDGDVLYVGEGFYVSVEAEKEDVLVMPFDDARSAVALAYELGNRHLPVSIGGSCLATPYDRLVEEMLAKSHVLYERCRERFEPVAALHHHG